MRKITTNLRLIEVRNKLICQLRDDGFFYEEIGEMFRLQKSRIAQIINKKEIANSCKAK